MGSLGLLLPDDTAVDEWRQPRIAGVLYVGGKNPFGVQSWITDTPSVELAMIGPILSPAPLPFFLKKAGVDRLPQLKNAKDAHTGCTAAHLFALLIRSHILRLRALFFGVLYGGVGIASSLGPVLPPLVPLQNRYLARFGT